MSNIIMSSSNERELSMPNRYKDWFAQSKRDLEQAVDSQNAGRHEWA